MIALRVAKAIRRIRCGSRSAAFPIVIKISVNIQGPDEAIKAIQKGVEDPVLKQLLLLEIRNKKAQ